MLKLKKIISGGQTGADQGGLIAGIAANLETGGTAPPGFVTDEGPQSQLLRSFGLIEGKPDPAVYPRRTIKNIRDSGGTLWVGKEDSPGGKLTLRIARSSEKPLIINPTPAELHTWLVQHQIVILNVAGNRERRNPGIGERTESLITSALQGPGG